MTFIDGVHYVQTGPERGHMRVLYKNTDINNAYIECMQQTSLASFVYEYLCMQIHYSDRCCRKLVTGPGFKMGPTDIHGHYSTKHLK